MKMREPLGAVAARERGRAIEVSAVADQQVRAARRPCRVEATVSDVDRPEMIEPPLIDPEGEVEEVTNDGTTPRKAGR